VTYCNCGRPTRDQAFVCDDCLDEWSADLGDMPWLDEQLNISITRQRGAATTGGPRGNETPLPWHDKASEALREVHTALAGWVRICVEEHVRHSSPHEAWPSDDIPSMSRWLMWRTDGLAFHEAGGEAVREVHRAAERARNIVFWKPLPRVYLGPCDLEVCEGDVYAKEGETFGRCVECDTVYAVQMRREAMERVLDDRLFGAAEIARLSTFLGLSMPRDQVRKLVNQWHHRGTLQPSAHDEDGNPRFRYGSVKVMLYRVNATRESA